MKSIIKNILPVAAFAAVLGMTSCVKDLDVTPIDERTDMSVDAQGLFTKCYANMAQEGNGGANGAGDVDGIDGGTSAFVRQLWNSQELPTDEAHCPWGDDGISAFNHITWSSTHPMLKGFYYRLYYGVTLCNHYLEVASDYNPRMTAEVRFLRALYYTYLIDGWGDICFTTAAAGGAPVQQSRATTFEWIVNELNEIEPLMADAKAKTCKWQGDKIVPGTDESYGRADKAAVWMLLTRLYLNAEVYTGKAEWQKAKDYAKKIIDSKDNGGYKLNTQETKNGWTAYQQLFMGDNGENGASCEAILPVICDGQRTTAWGCTLFLMAGTYKDDMIDSQFTKGNGTTDNWQGNRARRQLVEKFFPNGDAPVASTSGMQTAAKDDRALFWSIDRTLDITEESKFEEGYSVTKFCNYYLSGATGHNTQFPDADFFLMRAAEAYLAYAEADARLNNGTTSGDGTSILNQVRARAHASTRTSYSLSQIADEWSREFFFEGLRRTTLIRFGYFGGNSSYTWQWKGGTKNGSSVSANYNLFPFPDTEIQLAGETLKQNTGY